MYLNAGGLVGIVEQDHVPALDRVAKECVDLAFDRFHPNEQDAVCGVRRCRDLNFSADVLCKSVMAPLVDDEVFLARFYPRMDHAQVDAGIVLARHISRAKGRRIDPAKRGLGGLPCPRPEDRRPACRAPGGRGGGGGRGAGSGPRPVVPSSGRGGPLPRPTPGPTAGRRWAGGGQPASPGPCNLWMLGVAVDRRREVVGRGDKEKVTPPPLGAASGLCA